MTDQDYVPVIGIECHIQLNTNTKLFSAVDNDARDAAPNSLINHIDLGMPGALPVLNREAVRKAILMAYALNTTPKPFSYFERKHYFYPDLPKGYQITQLEKPIVVGGYVNISENDQIKKVRINRLQLEEDAGKSTHPAGADYSLVDLNRAGTPLFEIVSEPDIDNPRQARLYAKELYLMARYLDVSNADLYHGNIRFDINVSIKNPDGSLGVRTETKNLNSFRSVEKAAEYEISRQIDLLKKGKSIVQETRGWDDSKQKTFSQRSKEEAHDYRYFPEPDLPPIVIDKSRMEEVAKTLPMLPNQYRSDFKKIGLDDKAIEILLINISSTKLIYRLHEMHGNEVARIIANLLLNTSASNEDELAVAEFKLDENNAAELANMLKNKILSSTASKQVWLKMLETNQHPRSIADELNLIQISDETKIREIVKNVIDSNEKAVKDIKSGEEKAIGFLVGQVMKESKGAANPEMAKKLIKEMIFN